MSKKGPFMVAVLGLTESERRVLRSLCVLSNSRSRSYTIVSGAEAGRADLWVVDGSDPNAVSALASVRSRRPIPAVIIDPKAPTLPTDPVISRPIVASRLLSSLDLLVTRDLAYFPELVIGGDEDSAISPESEQITGTLDAQQESEDTTHWYTALVVDDSATIRKQIELALRLHHVEPACAETAEVAMDLLNRFRFDLIFLDVILPGGADGYQICRNIKKSKVHRNTPVIMLTGKSSTFDRVRGSLAGCDTYLTKPVDNDTFNTVLKKYL